MTPAQRFPLVQYCSISHGGASCLFVLQSLLPRHPLLRVAIESPRCTNTARSMWSLPCKLQARRPAATKMCQAYTTIYTYLDLRNNRALIRISPNCRTRSTCSKLSGPELT